MTRAFFVLLAGLLAATVQAAEAPRTGSFSTSFDTAAPYAKANVIMQRMMLGDVFRSSVQTAAEQGINLNAHTLNPAKETWDVYVPPAYDGSQAYGILIWLPANPAQEVPDKWKDLLDKRQLIYIAPRQAGDNQPVLERRVPLVLHGLNGIVHDYKIDPKRIYIGGSGGGATVAGNIALGFADVFQGAVFMQNAPQFGTAASPILAAALLEHARQQHYAIIASRDNPAVRRIAERAIKSMQDLCLSGAQVITRAESGDAGLLDTGLGWIMQPPLAVTAGNCVTALKTASSQAVANVRKLIETGDDLDAAAQAWQDTYLQYGNLIDADMQKLKETLAAKRRQRAPGRSLSRD